MAGDYRIRDRFVEAALSGKIKAGLSLMTREELAFEADGLGIGRSSNCVRRPTRGVRRDR